MGKLYQCDRCGNTEDAKKSAIFPTCIRASVSNQGPISHILDIMQDYCLPCRKAICNAIGEAVRPVRRVGP
jgi:hypothetical protein